MLRNKVFVFFVGGMWKSWLIVKWKREINEVEYES